MKRAMASGSAALALAVACSSAWVRFDHRTHLAQRPCGGDGQQPCVTCVSCHTGLGATHDRFAPLEAEKCAGCHEDATAKFRHGIRPAIAEAPVGKAILFSHRTHLEDPTLKGQCVKCHSGVASAGGTTLFPSMGTCLSCHRHQEDFDSGRCVTCHRLPDLRRLKPASFLPHDVAWMRRHADAARSQPAQCAWCHAQSACDGCHESSLRPGLRALQPEALEKSLVHRFDYVARHAVEARLTPGSCFTCHARTECDACHASHGVSAAVRGAQNPHPPGWASGLVANSHGAAARRDIASCAACHDQGAASNCVRCHKVGGIGGTPHPPGFRSTEPPAAPGCVPCHGGGL